MRVFALILACVVFSGCQHGVGTSSGYEGGRLSSVGYESVGAPIHCSSASSASSDAERVRLCFDVNATKIYYLHKVHLISHPNSKGVVNISIEIDGAGSVSFIDVKDSSPGLKGFEVPLVEYIHDMNFGADTSPGVYPYRLAFH